MSQAVSSRPRPVVAFLTDFGWRDGYVGVMKAVITALASDVQLIDITHDVAPQQIASAAWILATSYRYFPEHTIFVCVVDPGVGSSRRAVAAHAGEWFFVGPDNGLLSYVLTEQPVHAAVTLSNPVYHLAEVSATFHGRDIFAPVSAHLARGVAVRELGPAIAPASLQRLDLAPAVDQGTHLDAHIVHVDHFGNLISNMPLTLLPGLFGSSSEERPMHIVFPTLGTVVKQRSRFFADARDDGQPFMYEDSSGYVGVAVRNGNAARAIGAEFGTPIKYVRGAVAG
jgi:S-adenosylmethionine hydrolase